LTREDAPASVEHDARHPVVQSMLRDLRPAIFLTAVLLAGLADTSALSGEGAQTSAPPASPSQGVTVDRGTVTVDVRDVPLDDVLRTLSEQSGVNITVHSGGAAKVTQTFSGLSLDEGIRRLAPAYNVVLIYGSAPAEGPSGATRLVEVHVYETSKSPVTAVVDPQQRSTQLRTVRELSRKAQARETGALTALADLLTRDPDPAVRRSAAEALASIREPEAVSALRSGAADQDPTVRGKSLVSLGQMRDEASVAIVAQGATRDPDASVRRSAVWALSTLRSEDARRALEVAASDADPLVKQAAVGALKQWALRGKSN